MLVMINLGIHIGISRLRELWWVYRDLDWSEIAFQRSDLNYFERSNQSKKTSDACDMECRYKTFRVFSTTVT